MVTLKPLGTKVFIKPLLTEVVSEGGIHLPGSTQEEKDMGTVAFVGDLVTLVRPGDTVLYSRHMSSTVTYLKEKYRLLREQDIHAVEVPVQETPTP